MRPQPDPGSHGFGRADGGPESDPEMLHARLYVVVGIVVATIFVAAFSCFGAVGILFWGGTLGAVAGFAVAGWVMVLRLAFTREFWESPDIGGEGDIPLLSPFTLTMVPTFLVTLVWMLVPHEPDAIGEMLATLSDAPEGFGDIDIVFALVIGGFVALVGGGGAGLALMIIGLVVSSRMPRAEEPVASDAGEPLRGEARRVSGRIQELVRERSELASRIDTLRAPRDRMRRLDPTLYAERIQTLNRAIVAHQAHSKDKDEVISSYERLREKITIELEMYEAEAMLPESGHGHSRMQLQDELARVREADRALQDRIEAEIELDRHLR